MTTALRLIVACILGIGLSGLIAPSLAATAPSRIGIVTMQPGLLFFERFGHNAILVEDAETHELTAYNFGFFDPTEKDFFVRFLRGEMMYYMIPLPLQEDLTQYHLEGRGATVQWLSLSPEQMQMLADLLEERALPENARYRYDYFTDNCATKIRDILDQAMGGQLRSQLTRRSRGTTYRSESVRLASPASWMWLGFDIGLGPNADRTLTHWEDAFVPMRLAESLREVENTFGEPLVSEEQPLLPHLIAAEPAEQSRKIWLWWSIGCALALAVVFVGRSFPRSVATFALSFWAICGLFGLILLYLWMGTAHWSAYANQNLLLCNPLCLTLLPGAWRLARDRAPPGRLFARLNDIVALLATSALVLHWLPVTAQYNWSWIGLLLPIHWALAWTFGSRVHSQAAT